MSHAQMLRRSLIVAGLALTLTQCRDAFEPGTSARLAVTPILPSRASLADFGLTIDAVRFVAVRPPADTLADTTLALPPGAVELALDLRVPVLRNPDTVAVSVLALSGTMPLFSGTQLVPVPTPLPPPEIALDTYLGPAVDSLVIVPNTAFILTNDSLRFQVLGFNGGAPVSQFYVAWSTSDSLIASIDARGMLRAPGARAGVLVRARTPSGAADSVLAMFTPPASQLVIIAGGAQTDTVGNPLAVPLEVEARAADGLGVGGVTVRFRSVAGGGSVADSVVVTDAAGRARTTATLGALLGAQAFEASATGIAGSPIAFSATALPGAPAQVNASAGDAQLAVVGTAVATAPAVVVRDGAGNPVGGVDVTFTVTGGGGSVTGGVQTTGSDGVAAVSSWMLGTAAGPNTLRANVAGLARTFTATAIAGAPAQIVVAAGNLQSALVATVLAIDPAVRVEDQFGNPIAGATVSFAVSGGGGSVTGSTQLTNAAGVATVGSWGLGTSVGPNALTASLGGLTPATFTATGLAGVATTIIKLAGDLQSGIVNMLLGTAPQVRLVDQFGNPVAGTNVTFAIAEGGGGLIGASQTTDAAGIATLGAWTLGTAIGPNTVTATSGSLSTDFSATALPGLATQIAALLGDGQSALVNTLVAVAPAVVVRDAFNNPVPGVAISFTPSAGSSVTGGAAVTDASGVAQVGSWTLATLAGGNTLTASGPGLSVGFSATGLAGAATQLIKMAGDGLTAIVAQSIATMPVVKALDQFGNPVSGVSVTFSVTSGGGSVSGASAATSAAGLAALGGWTLGTIAGGNGVSASAAGGLSAAFSATGTPDVPALLQKVTGDGQTAVVNTALSTTPTVRLVDQYGNPIAATPVLFDIQVDGGSIVDPLPLTDASGLATPGAWTIADFVTTNLLQASSAGVPAVQFSAVGIPDVPSQLLRASIDTQTALVNQAVSVAPAVVVRDQYFNPVPGVAVSFAVTLGGGTVLPASATTDAAGVAQVSTWTLGPLVGLNTLDATAAGLGGSPITFSANGITTTATSMALFAGDAQSGVVANALGTPYAVRVLNAAGAPVQAVLVHWAVDSLGGVMSPATSLTDINGVATSTRFLGQIAGPQTATATVGGLTGSPVVFSATALPDVPFQLLKRSTDPQTGIVATLIAAPVVEVTDQYNNPVPDIPVSFALTGLGLLGTALDTTDLAGRATAGSWLLGNLIGGSSVTATVAGLSDAVFTASGIAGLATRVLELDGNGQNGPAGQTLPAPYRVRVTDLFGNPVRNITVNWFTDTRAGGGISPSAVATDISGIAAATHTLGTTVGSHSASAAVTGLADTVTFTSTAVAGAAAQILKDAGDAQFATVNTAVPTAPTVMVTDQFGAPVAGHSVTWGVVSGGGSLGGASPTTTTDAFGIAAAPLWTLGTAAGGNGLTATSAGLGGSPVAFTATGRAGPPTQLAVNAGNGQSAVVGTAVPIKPAVILKDQFNNPVPAVGVTFTVLSGGGSVTGGSAMTNAQGIATVGSWTLGTVAGGNALQSSATGLQPITFSATGVAGVPTQLAFLVPPTRSIAGDTIDPLVRVVLQDQHGNRNFSAQGLVQLGFGAMGDPAAKLVGTQAVDAVGGMATFLELAIDSAGLDYTLVASSGGLAGAESGPFDVAGVIDAVLGDRLDPVNAAFDPRTGLVFVPGQANTLGVFDPGKREIQQFPILQSPPFGVAVNTQTSRVWVTTQAGLVIGVDPRAPSTIVSTIDVLRPARGIAVDEATDRLFVAVQGDLSKGTPHTLVIISGEQREIIGSIPFPEGALPGLGVAFNPIDRLVYVAIPNLGVGVFDPAEQKHVATILIVGEEGAAGTHGVAVDVQARLVYATNRSDSSFSIIDPVGFKEDDRVRVGKSPEGLGVDPDKGVVYVANNGSGTVSFIALDSKTSRFTVFATLEVGPLPKAAAVDPGSGRVYVPTFEDDRVRVVQP